MPTKFNKYQYVSLQAAVGNANPYFTPQQYLQNRQVYGIEVFNSDDVPSDRSNLPLVSSAILSGGFLNLYCTDVMLPVQAIANSQQVSGQGWGLWFRDVPLTALHRTSTNANPYVRDFFELYGELIDFEQSYVNWTPAALAAITATSAVVFGVAYK